LYAFIAPLSVAYRQPGIIHGFLIRGSSRDFPFKYDKLDDSRRRRAYLPRMSPLGKSDRLYSWRNSSLFVCLSFLGSGSILILLLHPNFL